jgi:hypothetical protein
VHLSDYDTSRVLYHLGYNAGAQVPAGDVARVWDACRRIPDAHWYERVVEHVSRCDRALAASEVMKYVATTGAVAPSQIQLVSGDTNRSVAISDPIKADTIYWEIYLRETDRLAEILYVANYRREEIRVRSFQRALDGAVLTVPGPADTAVGTRVAQALGSFGCA